VAFQGLWFAAVLGAARGQPWLGLAALVPYLALHRLALGVDGRGLTRALFLGLFGAAIDGLLAALGWLVYPGMPADWPAFLVPPWIAALWIAFALLPKVSLAWLAPRPWLAVLLGALGGPLSALGGVRAGVLGLGEVPLLTLSVLALEYALLTPLLLRFVGPRRDPQALR
jgi:hypothetical protein